MSPHFVRRCVSLALVFAASTACARPQDFVEFHSNRVHRDMLLFAIHRAPQDKYLFSLLDIERERDRIQLFHSPIADARYASKNVELGIALFGTMTMLAAHMPTRFRGVFDNPAAHLGPAIFTNGGMGAGIGGEL
jgi:hypothetical protein